HSVPQIFGWPDTQRPDVIYLRSTSAEYGYTEHINRLRQEGADDHARSTTPALRSTAPITTKCSRARREPRLGARSRIRPDRYLFLITVGIGTKPVKVNFWTRLFSAFSGVTSAVYRLPCESTDKWCSVPNCPAPEPHDPNPSRNSSVLRLKIMICAWLRFATYR